MENENEQEYYDEERDPDQEAVESALTPSQGVTGRIGRVAGTVAGSSVKLVDTALSRAGQTIGPWNKAEAPSPPEDDFSDLLRGPSSDDPMMDASDLTTVSRDDIYGEGSDDLSDLFEVSEEDVMGPEIFDEPDFMSSDESPTPPLPPAPSPPIQSGPRVIRPRIVLSPRTLSRIQGGGPSVSGINY